MSADAPRQLACALSLGALAGCSASPAPRSALFVSAAVGAADAGRRAVLWPRHRGRAPLTDAEWAEFAAQTITPNFPDGFTVFDGEGQWRNPQTGISPAIRPKSCLSRPNARTRSRATACGCDRRLQDAVPPAIGRHHHPRTRAQRSSTGQIDLRCRLACGWHCFSTQRQPAIALGPSSTISAARLAAGSADLWIRSRPRH